MRSFVLAAVLAAAVTAASAYTELPQTLTAHASYNFSLYAPQAASKPLALVVMLSGYCLPAMQQEQMQLSYLSKMSEWGFTYAPLKCGRMGRWRRRLLR
jgi:hypothetical protein